MYFCRTIDEKKLANNLFFLILKTNGQICEPWIFCTMPETKKRKRNSNYRIIVSWNMQSVPSFMEIPLKYIHILLWKKKKKFVNDMIKIKKQINIQMFNQL